MKLIYWLIAGPLIALAVLFALSNREFVELSLWPLPFSLPAPIYVVAMGGMAIGFFAGGFVAWFGAGRTRSRARAAARAVRARDIELEDLRRKVKEAEIAEARNKADPAAPPKAKLPVAAGRSAR